MTVESVRAALFPKYRLIPFMWRFVEILAWRHEPSGRQSCTALNLSKRHSRKPGSGLASRICGTRKVVPSSRWRLARSGPSSASKMLRETWILRFGSTADQVRVEGRVVERRHADSVGGGCGAALFVRLDVRADEELSQRQIAERAAVSIDRPDMLAEPGLVIAAPGHPQRIRPLSVPDGCVGPRPFIGNGVPARRVCRREQDAPFIPPEVLDPHRPDRLV